MTNLVISSVCNMRCPYCFAESYMQSASLAHPESFLSVTAFERRLQFLDSSGIPEIRLMGGEPTLHPQFGEFIRIARLHHKHLVIFSHGLIPETMVALIEAIPPDECMVLINASAIPAGEHETNRLQTRRLKVLRRLGMRALLGYTIDRPGFNLSPLLEMIESSGCRKAIRVGLAQPIFGGSNKYLHSKQYRFVGKRLTQFAREASQFGVTLEMDCGFVRCMFSDEDLAALRQSNTNLGWKCNPILDITLADQALHCFPLAGFCGTPVDYETSPQELRDRLSTQIAPYRLAGIFRECPECSYRARGECMGGCMAAVLRRFLHTSFRVGLPQGFEQTTGS